MSCKVVFQSSFSKWWFQNVSNRYFAYESQHPYGAFDMTGGFKDVLFHPYLICFRWVENTNQFVFTPDVQEMIHFEEYFSSDLKPSTSVS